MCGFTGFLWEDGRFVEKKYALSKVTSCVLNAIILFAFISSFLGFSMGNSYIFHFIRLFTSKIIQCKVVCQTFRKISIKHTCCTWNLANVIAQTRTQFPLLVFLSILPANSLLPINHTANTKKRLSRSLAICALSSLLSIIRYSTIVWISNSRKTFIWPLLVIRG